MARQLEDGGEGRNDYKKGRWGRGGGREAIEGEVQKIGEIKFRQEQKSKRKVREFVLSILNLRVLLMYLGNIVPT